MKMIRRTLIAALVALSIAYGASAFYLAASDQDIGPKIECSTQLLEVSASASKADLLSGVTAYDEQDGDLTGKIMVAGISKLISNDTAKVTYLVFDSDDNMASFTRKIRYTDYRKPRFTVDPAQPLIYSASGDVTVLDRLGAQDVVDGDISDRVRVSTLSPTDDPEVYHITIQVTNSMGDTAWLKLPVQLLGSDPQRPTVTLSEQLVYVSAGEQIDLASYLSGVTLADGTAADASQVTISGEVDTTQPGTYYITYAYRHEASLGRALLTVVVV